MSFIKATAQYCLLVGTSQTTITCLLAHYTRVHVSMASMSGMSQNLVGQKLQTRNLWHIIWSNSAIILGWWSNGSIASYCWNTNLQGHIVRRDTFIIFLINNYLVWYFRKSILPYFLAMFNLFFLGCVLPWQYIQPPLCLIHWVCNKVIICIRSHLVLNRTR